MPTKTRLSELQARAAATVHEVNFGVQVRAVSDTSRSVDLRIIVADTETEIGWGRGAFWERIAASGISRAHRRVKDAFLLYHHHADQPLARMSAGSLRLRIDPRTGDLVGDADIAPGARGDQVLSDIRHGLIGGCSFAFVALDAEWDETATGEPRCTVLDFDIADEVTLTPIPAYETTSVSARSKLRTSSMTPRSRTRVREPAPYDDPNQSVVKDMLFIAESQARDRIAMNAGGGRGYGISEGGIGPVADAQKRLKRMRQDDAQKRAIGSSAGHGGQFEVFGLPEALVADFATECAAEATVSGLLFDPVGLPVASHIYYPRLLTGSSVAAQSDAGGVSETDPTTALVGGASGIPLREVTGAVELSQRLLDRSPNVDAAVTRSLAIQFAAALESQVISGDGNDPNIAGLLTVGASSPASYATYTDATPTFAEWAVVFHGLVSKVSTAAGYQAGIAVMHPRRWAWCQAQLAGSVMTSPGEQLDVATGRVGRIGSCDVYVSCGVPVANGGGGNEDVVFVISRPDELKLRMDPPKISMIADYGGSSTLTVKVLAHASAAFIPARLEALGALVGTGQIGPANY